MYLAQRGAESRELLLDLGERGVRGKVSDHPALAHVTRRSDRRGQVLRERNPELHDVALDAAVEPPVEDADDLEGGGLGAERASDDAGVSAIVPPPRRIADDRDARGPRGVVACRERATPRRLHPEQLEVGGGHRFTSQSLGTVVEQRDEPRARRASHAVQGRDLAGHVGDVGDRHVEPWIDVAGQPHAHEALTIGEWQWAERDRPSQAQGRGARRNAERDAQDRERGGSLVAREPANGGDEGIGEETRHEVVCWGR